GGIGGREDGPGASVDPLGYGSGDRMTVDQQGMPVAVERLAEEIARDLNNVLFVISGRLALLSRTVGPASQLSWQVGLIRRAAERAVALTQELLIAGRKRVLDEAELDVNALVTSMHERLRQLRGPGTNGQMALDPDLGRVQADPVQLEQVLLNAAANARDAMPAGGTLTLTTRNVELDDAFVARHHGARVGPHVMVAVTDTGVGMDAATCARAFEPFFTTRGPGQAGVGVAPLHRICEPLSGSPPPR